MKLPTWLLTGAVLVPALLSGAEFEGKVNFKMTPERGQSQEIEYAIKGGRIRVEMPGQTAMGGMILDPAEKETLVLMDEQRMYMTMPIPDASEADGKPAAEVKLEKTGETEKILGYTAEKYISTYEGTKSELWLADGIGQFVAFNNSGAPMSRGRRGGGSSAPQAWERALAGKDLFPLRVVTYDRAGKENFRMVVTRIDKQSLPDALFAPPAGYQKLDMGHMMRGMIPGAR